MRKERENCIIFPRNEKACASWVWVWGDAFPELACTFRNNYTAPTLHNYATLSLSLSRVVLLFGILCSALPITHYPLPIRHWYLISILHFKPTTLSFFLFWLLQNLLFPQINIPCAFVLTLHLPSYFFWPFPFFLFFF